jgi:hypothetical protein
MTVLDLTPDMALPTNGLRKEERQARRALGQTAYARSETRRLHNCCLALQSAMLKREAR